MSRKVEIELVVDADGVVRGVRIAGGEFQKLDKSINATGKKVHDLFDTFTKSLKVAAAAAVAALGAAIVRMAASGIRRAFELGTAVEETASKFKTVFGEASADVDRFLDEFANMAGLTKTEGREIVATLGAMSQGFGMSSKESGDFSESVVRLAGDMASFNNASIEDTLAAIRSGLVGEQEPLRRYGILLTAAKVEQRALEMSIGKTKEELTEQEKVLARLSLTYEEAGVQVGDLERTQDSTANSARNLSSIWREQQEQLSEALLPTFGLVLAALRDITTSTEDTRNAFIRFVSEGIFEVVRGLVEMGYTMSNAITMVVNFGRALGLVGDEISPQGIIAKRIDTWNRRWAMFATATGHASIALERFKATYRGFRALVQEKIGLEEAAQLNRELEKEARIRIDSIRAEMIAASQARDQRNTYAEELRAELDDILNDLNDLSSFTPAPPPNISAPEARPSTAANDAMKEYISLSSQAIDTSNAWLDQERQAEAEMEEMHLRRVARQIEEDDARVAALESFKLQVEMWKGGDAAKQEAIERTLAAQLSAVDTSIQSNKDMLRATIDVVRNMIQAYYAQAIAKSLASLGISALIAGPFIAIGLNALFNKLIPKFRHGVDDFEGGVAQVHKDEIIYLPPGSSVVSQNESRRMMSAAQPRDAAAANAVSQDESRPVVAAARSKYVAAANAVSQDESRPVMTAIRSQYAAAAMGGRMDIYVHGEFIQRGTDMRAVLREVDRKYDRMGVT